ncbi:hypothetical protein HYS28_02510 [Candidatus Uhrbacteria bacterium]|nr:hypothetical protein [Candidatus Uhrbacteria bacterium]
MLAILSILLVLSLAANAVLGRALRRAHGLMARAADRVHEYAMFKWSMGTGNYDPFGGFIDDGRPHRHSMPRELEAILGTPRDGLAAMLRRDERVAAMSRSAIRETMRRLLLERERSTRSP